MFLKSNKKISHIIRYLTPDRESLTHRWDSRPSSWAVCHCHQNVCAGWPELFPFNLESPMKDINVMMSTWFTHVLSRGNHTAFEVTERLQWRRDVEDE